MKLITLSFHLFFYILYFKNSLSYPDYSECESYYKSQDAASLLSCLRVITAPGKSASYNALWETYIKAYTKSNGYIKDYYSSKSKFTSIDKDDGLGGENEGEKYNREHSVPKSWWGGTTSEGTQGNDPFIVIPTDKFVNNKRSNYPLGIVDDIEFSSYESYSKIGISKGNYGYTGKVFEPNDDVKGDLARIYFYSIAKYITSYNWVLDGGSVIFSGNEKKNFGLTDYAIKLFTHWNEIDPPDEFEVNLNQKLFDIQGNTNPFIDHPEYINVLWGNHPGEKENDKDNDNEIIPIYRSEKCSNKYDGCLFTLTNDYPVSPKIPTSFPTQAILGDYKYIYLKFTIPQKQEKKSFYLEAYYISDGETIISNGDCYYINTNENIDYELRIFKTLRENDYIRFGFFGIPDDFIMEVKLHFILNITLYFNDIALSIKNSLNKTSIPELEEYLIEKEKKIKDQKNREKIVKEICKKIMKNMFNIDLDADLFEGDSFFSSIIVPISPFIVTKVSYVVSYVMKIENFFHRESIIISETNFKDGKIVSHQDGLDYLEGNALINNDVLKMVEYYNKRMTDKILDIGLDGDFTLTISTNKDINYIDYILKLYDKNNEKISSELKFQIKLTNSKINELIVNTPSLPEIFDFIPLVEKCLSENAVTIKEKIEYLTKGIYLINGIFDLMISKPQIVIKKASLLIKKADLAKIGGTLLDMDADEKGIYHARFDCWQQCVGYTKFYDSVFDLFTDMRYNNEGMFKFKNINYILWAWKGDYINLGAGAELGFYYGGEDENSIWKVDKSLAMPMTLTLIHKINGTIVDNWKNTTWWITAFNPNFQKVLANDLTAYYTVKFTNDDMFKEFTKIERKGWSYNVTSKIASLIL